MDVAKIKLKRLISELEKVRGRHTELISVYIPAGYSLDIERAHLSEEQGTAANIKSKSTRKKVTSALEKILGELRLHKKTPANGLIVFCGDVGKENKSELKIWTIEPPEPLNLRLYRCDQTFLLEPLKEMLEAKDVYGLVVVDNREVTIGFLKGKAIEVTKHATSMVPGKMRAGGQSSARFARGREEAAKSWYKKIAQSIVDIFSKEEDFNGIIVGGPGPVKDDVIEFLPERFQKKVLGVKDISYTDESGLHELVENSKDLIKEKELFDEKKIMDEFLTLLGKGTLTVYGEKETLAALEMGAIRTLLISEEFDAHKMEEFSEKARDLGTEVRLISDETKQGKQLFELSGIAGILRYNIN